MFTFWKSGKKSGNEFGFKLISGNRKTNTKKCINGKQYNKW